VASALNLYAKTDASASRKQQERHMEEQDAQSAVDSQSNQSARTSGEA
jgi:hypothetical protein